MVHALSIVNMHAKFDELIMMQKTVQPCIHKVISIMMKVTLSIVIVTFDLQNQ